MPKKSTSEVDPSAPAEQVAEVPPVLLGDEVRYVLSDKSPNAGQIRVAKVTSVRPDAIGLNVLVGHKNDFKVGSVVPTVSVGQIPVVIASFFLDSAKYDGSKSAGTWHLATD